MHIFFVKIRKYFNPTILVIQKYLLPLPPLIEISNFGESVAQQVEHNTFNVGVPGSSPGGFTEKRRVV